MAASEQTGTAIIFKVADSGGTPSAIGGETDVSVSINGDEIDVSNKDTSDLKSFIAGRADVTISGSAITIFDDSAGGLDANQDLIIDKALDRGDVDIEVAIGSGGTQFAATAFITQCDIQGPDNQPGVFNWTARVKSSITFTA